jgi:hypothetical protein
MTPQQQEAMATVAWSGFTAMRFVTDARIWPAFTAWAEQNVPGAAWDEADRLCMDADSRIMLQIAKRMEKS